MPAIQSAREAARRNQCQNNLKQLATGFMNHESTFKHLPSGGGWGFYWVGVPDQGNGEDQPGGWTYNILNFIEEQTVRQLGTGQTGAALAASLTQLNTTPMPVFHCPTRRPAALYPNPKSDFILVNPPQPRSAMLARTDYAANGGDDNTPKGGGDPFDVGPASLAAAATYNWRFDDLNGVVFQRSHVRLSRITDGTSKTYMIGERYIDVAHYSTGEDPADDQGTFVGFNHDTLRWSFQPPEQDRPGVTNRWSWGAAHVVFQMAYCDGSVHVLSYDVDVDAHRWLGNREDGIVK